VGNVKAIDYDMIIPVLIKAIQEQETLIESLQKEIKKLKSGSSTSKVLPIPKAMLRKPTAIPPPWNRTPPIHLTRKQKYDSSSRSL
jgi:hypothetical protein